MAVKLYEEFSNCKEKLKVLVITDYLSSVDIRGFRCDKMILNNIQINSMKDAARFIEIFKDYYVSRFLPK